MPLTDAMSERSTPEPVRLDPALVPIMHRESGGKPFVGYSGVDLSGAPLRADGFPIWSGAMGPEGISHAAGLFQMQPGTWAPIAKKLGITDFSVESQIKVANELKRQQGLAPWAASAPGYRPGGGGAGGGRVRYRADGTPEPDDTDESTPRSRDRLARAVASSPAPPEEAAPQQAAAAPVAVAAPRPLALQPIATPPVPNIYQGYRNALATILNGRRRPFGSIFG